ncbi:YARHG domain-containing protein [Hyphomicrobium sp. LHD-15]|uniref:YARHG domain-containing protein n=1 Tax=Hyphomicrobium sp. LHD-15 TaxID=3072142 RepID=UPI00280E1789|nr:YARHG domain-containing protein [Hyphomicrobium sp. LHD-15]MDQ8700267.1 YARHG domain-containing protein [Hyphomicrobium sp. LHD-15]
MIRSAQSLLPASALMLAATTSAASAGCHLVDCVENVFVTPQQLKTKSCEDLWILRNSIWKDAGYCFKTPRAIKAFGTQGCLHTDQSAVPLNEYQRRNAETLLSVETEKGC